MDLKRSRREMGGLPPLLLLWSLLSLVHGT